MAFQSFQFNYRIRTNLFRDFRLTLLFCILQQQQNSFNSRVKMVMNYFHYIYYFNMEDVWVKIILDSFLKIVYWTLSAAS